jgi:hypothetical protein
MPQTTQFAFHPQQNALVEEAALADSLVPIEGNSVRFPVSGSGARGADAKSGPMHFVQSINCQSDEHWGAFLLWRDFGFALVNQNAFRAWCLRHYRLVLLVAPSATRRTALRDMATEVAHLTPRTPLVIDGNAAGVESVEDWLGDVFSARIGASAPQVIPDPFIGTLILTDRPTVLSTLKSLERVLHTRHRCLQLGLTVV